MAFVRFSPVAGILLVESDNEETVNAATATMMFQSRCRDSISLKST